MSYLNAPATQMLATHCCVCQRPLLDAQSVELGIGPDCRKRHGYNIDVPPEARAEANVLVAAIAADCNSPTNAPRLQRLVALGFTNLVTAVVSGMAGIRIDEADGRLVVRSPYSPEGVAALRAVPGRRWDGERKVNTFPVSSKLALWAALKSAYRGAIGISARGVFQVL